MWNALAGSACRKWWRAVVVAAAVAVAVGCGPSKPERLEDFLVRVDNLKFTDREFAEAFELVKTAYPGSLEGEGEGLKNARVKLLEEMTVELVLSKRAEELNISVTEDEIEAAVKAVKEDYPPGLFEQTLIEAAVPLEVWRRRMGARLLVEKVIEKDLRDRIVVTAEDVRAYYEQHYRGKAAEADSEEKLHRLRGVVVAELKRKKVEDAYGGWIAQLKSRYPVEINARLWERILPQNAADTTRPAARAGSGD